MNNTATRMIRSEEITIDMRMLLPFCVTVMIFSEILTPFVNGGSIQWNHIWMLWGAGIVSAILVFLAAKNDYRKTYIASYCDEFVREMPDGYQTVLGENGSTLSGGERQRISIARALLKNAPIILLDEATASLDPENEVLVQKAIAKLVEGKTVIMIAHRLRTVVDADQILVLDNGRLVEHGTHDELMKKNGLYHNLFHIQQESLGWAV